MLLFRCLLLPNIPTPRRPPRGGLEQPPSGCAHDLERQRPLRLTAGRSQGRRRGPGARRDPPRPCPVVQAPGPAETLGDAFKGPLHVTAGVSPHVTHCPFFSAGRLTWLSVFSVLSPALPAPVCVPLSRVINAGLTSSFLPPFALGLFRCPCTDSPVGVGGCPWTFPFSRSVSIRLRISLWRTPYLHATHFDE